MTYKGAIKQLYEMRDNIWMPEFFKPYFDKIIETLTADVRENVRGEWILTGEIEEVRAEITKCSVCGCETWGGGHFCCGCGADMRGNNHD